MRLYKDDGRCHKRDTSGCFSVFWFMNSFLQRLPAGAALACAVLAAPAAAADVSAPLKDDRATWSFVWENDYFANTDRNYTNGLHIAYVSGLREPEGASRFFANTVLRTGSDAKVRRGFAVGHSIFTPEDTTASQALPDQHPYAGWLYGEYSVIAQQPRRVQQFTFQAGIVGPAAQGEWVQNNWHDLINGDPVNGWDNQIGNEPGFVLSYDRKFRAFRYRPDAAFGADLTPSIGASVGNVHTRARAGLTLRVGHNLKADDYGPARVRPALAGTGYFSDESDFSWHLFLGLSGNAVAHNIFLDGSLFRDDDPSVDSRTFVGEIQAGLAVQVRRVQIAYTFVERSKEFETQSSHQEFGAVSIAVKF